MNHSRKHTWFAGLLGWALCLPALAQSTLIPMVQELEAQASVHPHSEFERGLQRLAEKADPIVLRTLCDGLMAEYPGRLQIKDYGLSKAGRPLLLLTIVPPEKAEEGAAQGARIAMVVPSLDREPQTVALLRQVKALLEDPSLQGNLRVWVVLMPDPDRWVGGAKREVHFDLNFPWRWSPWDELGRNPGAAPCCEPESKQLLALLLGERAIAGILGFGGGRDGTLPVPTGGSLRGYAEMVLGLPWQSAKQSEGETDLGAGLMALRQRTDALAGEVLDVKRLAENRWCVDLVLHNTAPLRSAGLGQTLGWHMIGGKVLKACVAPLGEPDYKLLANANEHSMPLGCSGYQLRLIVESTGGETLFVRFESPRIPGLGIEVPLGAGMPRPR